MQAVRLKLIDNLRFLPRDNPFRSQASDRSIRQFRAELCLRGAGWGMKYQGNSMLLEMQLMFSDKYLMH